MSADTPDTASSANKENQSGCVTFVVSVVMPGMCLLVATIGLWDGAAVIVDAERVRARQMKEVIETRANITFPRQQIVDPGRVDVTVQRRILGLIPVKTERFIDVVETGSFSGSNTVRTSRGSSSTSATSELTLKEHNGCEWRSPTASHLLGTNPGEVRQRLDTFINGSTKPRLRLWWASWLSNVVGLPFALVSLLLVYGALNLLVKRGSNRKRENGELGTFPAY